MSGSQVRGLARRLRRAGAGALLVATGLASFPGAASGHTGESVPEVSAKKQELLDTYAPVMTIRKQKKKCDGDERFRPMSVDYVLGRDDVVLRNADGDVVKEAPTAEDLAGLGSDYWLDFPGNALDPGCSYEKWFRSFDATPSIYGRVTTDQGQLVAQYWFYWAFNQWNDVHESDWEMIQLHFDTDDIDVAIARGPSLYAYAQHEGAEYAKAGDAKVEIVDGTHPVVFSSGGSHASYYGSTRWFGKSGSTGFGCDDTTAPTERITPEVIALPTEAPTTGEFAWLSYQGHWGQKERFFNNGPTGPAAKGRWDNPIEWVYENGREGSVSLPFARSGATKAFCGLSATGSALFNRVLDDPIKVVALLVVGLTFLVVAVRFGSRGLLGRAARTWWRARREFLLIAAVTFAGGALVSIAQLAVVEFTVVGRLVDVVGGSSPWVLPLVTLAGALIAVPYMGWVIAASTDMETGERTAGASLWWAGTLGSASLRSGMVVVALIGLTIFVFPPAVILASLWLLAPAASGREGLTTRAALKQSRRLLKHHRWRSLALTVTLCLVLAVSGVVGALVLLVSTLGFAAAALTVAAVNAFLTPYAALVAVLFYSEIREPAREEPAPAAPAGVVWGRMLG